MRIIALKNKRKEESRKIALAVLGKLLSNFWEDDEVRAVRRIESKIFEKRFERLSPVFSKTRFVICKFLLIFLFYGAVI